MNKKKHGYLLPIRKEWCDKIFHDQRKFFEYRTKFDPTFEGRIFVYESGKDGCHKVIGFFNTHTITKVVPGKLVDEPLDNLMDSLPDATVQETLSLGVECYAIPILAPATYDKPMTLEEFSRLYDLDKIWIQPPQSRARITYEHPSKSLAVSLVETTLEGVKPPFGNK